MKKTKVTKCESHKDLHLISLNVPVRVLNQYTEYAQELGVARSNLMIIALNEYLTQREVVNQIPALINELNKQQPLKSEVSKRMSDKTR